MELIFNKLIIIDHIEKVAKIQEFKKGINIVTSNDNGIGNYKGKSTLLKSIFHSLGADAKFDNSKGWEVRNKYFYILDFTLNDNSYKIMRFNNLFIIFKDSISIYKTINREELSNYLSHLFNMKIFLKESKTKQYKQAQPFAYYCLNFIDQKSYVGCGFDSFDRMYQYSTIYKDLIYAHLGLDNSKLSTLIDKININKEKLKNYNVQLDLCSKILEKLKNNVNSSPTFENLDTIKIELEKNKNEYNKLIEKYNNIKYKLFELNNHKTLLENSLLSVQNCIKEKNKKDISVLTKHTCPLCMNEINNYNEVFFKRVKSSDAIQIQYVSLQEEIAEVSRKIDFELNKYKELEENIEKFEKQITQENKTIEDKIVSMGLKKYQENIMTEYSELFNKTDKINKLIDEDTKEERKLFKEINKLNDEYEKIFTKLLLKYNVSIINHDSKFKLDIPIKCSDLHLLSVFWIMSLNILKRSHNNLGLFLPFVLDDPTDRDFDKNNVDAIFDLIFDNNDVFQQIILSKVDFDFSKYTDYDINHIQINNELYKLLNEEDYNDSLDLLNSLISEIEKNN